MDCDMLKIQDGVAIVEKLNSRALAGRGFAWNVKLCFYRLR